LSFENLQKQDMPMLLALERLLKVYPALNSTMYKSWFFLLGILILKHAFWTPIQLTTKSYWTSHFLHDEFGSCPFDWSSGGPCIIFLIFLFKLNK
jgi:hypothetical protein